jgi:uncharacterized protein (UPF0333 family)
MIMRNKAQSAMEYLMTYGWAILIVIVVIAALYAMGVFTPKAGGGTCSPCFAKFAFIDYAGGTLKLTTQPQEINITAYGGATGISGCLQYAACPASTDITLTGISTTTAVVDLTINYNVTASGLAHSDTAKIHN